MPFEGRDKEVWDKGYYAGYRKATIDHLGRKCFFLECQETDPRKLEIHHVNGLDRKGRNLGDLEKLEELRLLCKTHHGEVKEKEVKQE